MPFFQRLLAIVFIGLLASCKEGPPPSDAESDFLQAQIHAKTDPSQAFPLIERHLHPVDLNDPKSKRWWDL